MTAASASLGLDSVATCGNHRALNMITFKRARRLEYQLTAVRNLQYSIEQ